MITYNPNNELTDAQLKELSEDDFFSYLDQKAAHLKQFTRPLGSYETKHFAAWTKGDSLTTEELKKAKEIGKQGDMIYNPNNELTDEQMKALSEADFFEYLDTKAAYLKQFTAPIGQYHAKQFAAMTKGGELTTKELKRAKELGKIGDDERARKIAEAASKLGNDPKFKDAGIKNIKTNRTQWFD